MNAGVFMTADCIKASVVSLWSGDTTNSIHVFKSYHDFNKQIRKNAGSIKGLPKAILIEKFK